MTANTIIIYTNTTSYYQVVAGNRVIVFEGSQDGAEKYLEQYAGELTTKYADAVVVRPGETIVGHYVAPSPPHDDNEDFDIGALFAGEEPTPCVYCGELPTIGYPHDGGVTWFHPCKADGPARWGGLYKTRDEAVRAWNEQNRQKSGKDKLNSRRERRES